MAIISFVTGRDEASLANGINGDPNSTGATQSGAAYVFQFRRRPLARTRQFPTRTREKPLVITDRRSEQYALFGIVFHRVAQAFTSQPG